MKLPKLPQFVVRLLSPITSRIQARKDKKAAEAAKLAAEAAIQADKQLIDDLVAGLPNTEALMVRTCLENQLVYLSQELAARSTSGLIHSKEVMMRLGKRIMMELLRFRGVIGIQPMSAPAALAYSMRFSEDPVTEGPSRLRLEVVPNAVAARSRKLQARFNLEAAEDLKTVFALDFEQELIAILATECAEEYAASIVHDLNASAGERLEATGETSAFVSTAVDSVLVAINQAANRIAQLTRRGAGNVLIMSPIAFATLSTSKNFPFTQEEDASSHVTMLRKMGVVAYPGGGKMFTVYTSLSPELSQDGKETIIVGYKGGSGECDTAYILCPYIPIVSNGVTIDPATFSPQLGLSTRYGQFTARGDENEMYNIENYYHTVSFSLTNFLKVAETSES